MKTSSIRKPGPSLNRTLWLYSLSVPTKAVSNSGAWKCPKCAVEMRSVALPNLTVEICPECRGIFLDDGELEKLGG